MEIGVQYNKPRNAYRDVSPEEQAKIDALVEKYMKNRPTEDPITCAPVLHEDGATVFVPLADYLKNPVGTLISERRKLQE